MANFSYDKSRLTPDQVRMMEASPTASDKFLWLIGQSDHHKKKNYAKFIAENQRQQQIDNQTRSGDIAAQAAQTDIDDNIIRVATQRRALDGTPLSPQAIEAMERRGYNIRQQEPLPQNQGALTGPLPPPPEYRMTQDAINRASLYGDTKNLQAGFDASRPKMAEGMGLDDKGNAYVANNYNRLVQDRDNTALQDSQRIENENTPVDVWNYARGENEVISKAKQLEDGGTMYGPRLPVKANYRTIAAPRPGGGYMQVAEAIGGTNEQAEMQRDSLKAYNKSRTEAIDKDDTFNLIMDMKDLATEASTGISGWIYSLGSGKADRLEGLTERLMAKLQFGALQTMKDSSESGGAVGSLSDPEREALGRMGSSINQYGDLSYFNQDIDSLLYYYMDKVYGLKEGDIDALMAKRAEKHPKPTAGGVGVKSIVRR